VGTAGHQVVPCAFRCCTGQNGRLDVDKAVFFQVVTDVVGNFGAKAQLVLNLGAAQVDVAVAQPHILTHLLVLVQLKRRGFGPVQYDQLLAQHLDLTGTHLLVEGALRAGPDAAADRDHILIAHAVCQLETLFPIRVEYDLGDPLTVTQVEKDDSAMVAATVYPAAECDIFTDMF